MKFTSHALNQTSRHSVEIKETGTPQMQLTENQLKNPIGKLNGYREKKERMQIGLKDNKEGSMQGKEGELLNKKLSLWPMSPQILNQNILNMRTIQMIIHILSTRTLSILRLIRSSIMK